MAKQNATLYLIDGHSLTFKAYYAIRGLTSPQGHPTGAVFGFLRILLKFLDDYHPDHLAVVFDTGKPTFRKDLYEQYKANREAPPEDFEQQMEWVYSLLKGMGIATFEKEGYEADDVIATMAEEVKQLGAEVSIVSADKDLLQLVDERVRMIRPGTKETKHYDPALVHEELGIRPDQMIDWLALVGDSSDNIPGVPGIGAKTASKLLAEFNSLDELIERADELKRPKQRESIKENAEAARLSRRLATCERSVPIEWSLQQCQVPENVWREPAIQLMVELGFDSVLKEHEIEPAQYQQQAESGEREQLPTDYRMVAEAGALQAWVEEALEADWVALDTETDGTDAMRSRLVGISLSCKPGHAIYVPVGHRVDLCEGAQLKIAEAAKILRPLFKGGAGPRLTAHHAKFDWKVLRRHGFEITSPKFDTMIASYLLDPDKASGHGLKALAMEMLGVPMTPITDLIGKGKSQIGMDEVAVEDCVDYACRDADVTMRLTQLLEARIAEIPALQKLMETLELPLVEVLLEMEMGGFALDVECLREMGKMADQRSREYAEKIWDAVGHPFNIGSPKQVGAVLFEELKLAPGKKKKTGYSTAEAELERLSRAHPVPRLILEYRAVEKLKSTYIEALPKLVHPQTQRIHTSFNQTIAATGRLSSTDPNLQNIPIRTEMGRAIRRAFVADRPDQLILKADYSQIELRILAHMSRDEALCAAYRENRDIHRQTASEVFGVSPQEVTPDMRAEAKVINFGIIYGMSAHGLAQQLGTSRGQAGEFIDRYFNTYPGVRRWIEQLLETARRQGWVETLEGRRRWVPDVNQKNRMIRSNAERIAVNTPIQGTCADMIKRAMLRIHRGLPELEVPARMVCQVHDELVFSVDKEAVEKVGEYVRDVMTDALPLSVPIRVDVSWAANWAEC